MSYSILYRSPVTIYAYKRSIGIYLNDEFVFFLSNRYIETVYGISIPQNLEINPGNIDIRAAVKREKISRIKLNRK